jgi:predicted amidohydrolase
VKVAAIQMTSGHDIDANLEAAGRLLSEAARLGAVLAALPENFAFMGVDSGDKRAIAEPDGAGKIQNFLADTARRLELWIVGGTVPLRSSTAGDGRVSASSLVYDADGRRVARYDKIHLFDVDVPGSVESHRESAHTVPGREPRVVESPAGKLGLSVCYDMRFPELFRVLSRQGADLFVVPAAFTVPTGRAHWESLLRARAIENLCALIAPAQWGVHPSGRATYGDSLIVDHWGTVLARLTEGTGCVVADLDHAARLEARAKFPVLEHRTIYDMGR